VSQHSPRRRLSPAARREQLIDATLALAAGGDIALVAVQDIAAHAGVSEGLLYHYFPTKQAIVAAAVTRAADTLLAELQSAPVRGGPRQQLEAALDAYLNHVQAQPTSWRALLAARGGELADLATSVEQQSHAWTLSILDVPTPGPVLHIALTGWAAFERDACLAWLDQPHLDRTVIKTLLMTTFTAALTAAAEHDAQARHALARLDATY
jgi:AcrR family transcriptional regulator